MNMEESAWVRSFSNVFELKRDSRKSGVITLQNAFSRSITQRLSVSEDVNNMMGKTDTLEFDIFELKQNIKDQFLVTMTSILF